MGDTTDTSYIKPPLGLFLQEKSYIRSLCIGLSVVSPKNLIVLKQRWED